MALSELLRLGGWTMVPILGSSLLSLMVFLGKLYELSTLHLSELAWVDPFLAHLRQRDLASARSSLESVRHPAARVLAAGLAVEEERPDRMEAEARRVARLELQRAEAYLAVLAFVAEAAPLLGLLGTVLGMLDLFQGMQEAGLEQIDLGQLSSGIWQALLTTAAGLTVALPSLAAFNYLSSRADRMRLQISDLLERALTAFPSEPRKPAP